MKEFREREFDEDEDAVAQSHIEDLIQHAVRDQCRNFLPVEWSHFLQTLREHNIPRNMLKRDTLDEMEHAVSPSSTPLR